MSDLFDDIVPATLDPIDEAVEALREAADAADMEGERLVGQRYRRIADALSITVRRTASVEYRNNGSTGYAKAFKHVCSGCGREFDSNRRQLPGKRVWCGRDECRKEAAALRARDYRDRKAKETT